MIDQFFTI